MLVDSLDILRRVGSRNKQVRIQNPGWREKREMGGALYRKFIIVSMLPSIVAIIPMVFRIHGRIFQIEGCV